MACPRNGDRPDRLGLTVGEVLRAGLAAVRETLPLGARPLRVLRQLAACGTFQLGANLLACENCQRSHWAARSCGDRHCPRCLAGKSRHWLQQQVKSLLPVTYYHAVFTLPTALHRLLQINPTRLYPLLFDAASQALLEFGRNRLGGDLGITAVLHTWGQQLNFHPHLHAIVTGGAWNAHTSRWRSARPRKFLFPVRPLAGLFRGKFLAGLKILLADRQNPLRWPTELANPPLAQARWLSALYHQPWHLYIKRPFGGPDTVLAYLANYTHRVALSNRRLVHLDPDKKTVTFTYRDYRDASKVKPLTLSTVEFIRRFTWHILPTGLVRIRHYGILGNNRRHRDIPKARAFLEKFRRRPPSVAAACAPTAPTPPPACPHCGSLKLRWVGFIDPRGHWHLPQPAKIDSS